MAEFKYLGWMARKRRKTPRRFVTNHDLAVDLHNSAKIRVARTEKEEMILEDVGEIIASLENKMERDVIVKTFYDKLTPREIADSMDISVGHYHHLKKSAFAKLKKLLRKNLKNLIDAREEANEAHPPSYSQHTPQ